MAHYKVILFAKETTFCDYAADLVQSTLGDDFLRLSPQAAREQDWNSVTCDYLVSFLYPTVIPKDVLAVAKSCAINFHPGPPEYPGTGCYNFALYDESPTYGATAHEMLPKVDSGRIFWVNRFAVGSNDTVSSLKLKSTLALLNQLQQTLDTWARGETLADIDENWIGPAKTRKQLNELGQISKDMDDKEIQKRVRALDYKFEFGASITLAGHRFIYADGETDPKY